MKPKQTLSTPYKRAPNKTRRASWDEMHYYSGYR